MSVIRAPQGLLVLLLSALPQLAGAQTAGDLQKQLETQFPLTKTTADNQVVPGEINRFDSKRIKQEVVTEMAP